MQKTECDWQYYAQKSDKASLSIPRGSYWPRGRMLGGSSSINAMMYVRGNRLDYDTWEEMGNPGWSYAKVLKYFKKSEDNQMAGVDDEFTPYHGKGGPMKVDWFLAYDPMKDMIVEAAKELKFDINANSNGDFQMGFSYMQGTVYKGRRESTAKAFLAPIKDRPNLHVVKEAYVTTLILNDKVDKVEGVEMLIGFDKLKVKARKEVILSAGALGSPQILMSSGIGPKEHLKEAKIELKKDMPVGKNLQDHAIVWLPLKLHKSSAVAVTEHDLVDELFMYLMSGVGAFSHMGTLDLTGFVNTVNRSSEYPDIQYHFMQYRKGENARLTNVLNKYGYDEHVRKSLMSGIEDSELLMVMVVLARPKSRGRIELGLGAHLSLLDRVRIFANYLDEQEDVDTFIRGINVMKRFVHTKASKKHEVEILKINLPGCSQFEFDQPGYWECYVRHMTSTVYHPTSTCKMGPDSDQEAVVDARLRVKGIKGLRVVDASIMPNIVAGNTNAPTIMIGEKGADLIKEDWEGVDETPAAKDSSQHTEL